MTNLDTLKYARNMLLALHKAMIDHERAAYEALNGRLNAGQFLNLLLEDREFSWLRKFSTLIVEIDELLDLKDGIPPDQIQAHLDKIKDLVSMTGGDEDFRSKYANVIQSDIDTAGLQAKLQGLMNVGLE
jgi:hypothetical protein